MCQSERSEVKNNNRQHTYNTFFMAASEVVSLIIFWSVVHYVVCICSFLIVDSVRNVMYSKQILHYKVDLYRYKIYYSSFYSNK